MLVLSIVVLLVTASAQADFTPLEGSQYLHGTTNAVDWGENCDLRYIDNNVAGGDTGWRSRPGFPSGVEGARNQHSWASTALAGHNMTGQWLQWEGLALSGGSAEMFLEYRYACASADAPASIKWDVLAGTQAQADADDLRTLITDAVGTRNTWAWGELSLGTGTFQSTDTVVRLVHKGSTTALRMVEVDYLRIPEPATLCLLGLGGIGVLIRRRHRA